MQPITTRTTPFQTVEVWGNDERSEIEFRVTGGTHAWWHRDHFLTGLAWDNIAAGVLSHPGEPVRVAMLGLGGGTSLRTLRWLLPAVELTAVEIDGDMISLAREFMDLDSIGARIIHADAYAWLAENRETFDVIFDDVYGVTTKDVERPVVDVDTVWPHLRRSLAPDGIFAANLVIGPGHRNVQSAFRQFFRSRFAEVRSITTEASLNECLTAGAALRPWREIRPAAQQFPDDVDYCFWRKLVARRL